MSTLSRLGEEHSRLVTYSVDSDEKPHEAIIAAFLTSNIDIDQHGQSLQDQIAADAIDDFDWEASGKLLLTFPLWGHQVTIAPEAVTIYDND
jgi:hypothetical protein